MMRDIVRIDEALCDGCGLCAVKCEEGAIRIIGGKARLVSESYCDGLGACLGECPRGAITIERREAPVFDEEAVREHLAKPAAPTNIRHEPLPCGCPGSAVRTFGPRPDAPSETTEPTTAVSELRQWPVQLRLVPEHAPFLKGADILVCADCVPFALPDFHSRYLKGRAVLVGCPKLDDLTYYREKIAGIFREASPSSVTVLRMEVPCCGGIAKAAIEARDELSPGTPVDILTVHIDGSVTGETVPSYVAHGDE
jgi:Pyruvate/2-oxoacid:ferredoxin oxidoreductase delta subunit